MFSLHLIVRSFRIVRQPLLKDVCTGVYRRDFVIMSTKSPSNSKNMSQMSMMSFFKKTPKKSQEKPDEEKSPNHTESSPKSSPIKNGTVKAGTKESRSSSSDCETDPNKPKKKTKRQRIESTSSESDTTAKEETPTIKLEISEPKTYSTPKNKKTKIKQEKGTEEKKKTPKTAKKSKSPPSKKAKLNIKSESSSPVGNGSGEKSPELKEGEVNKENKSDLKENAVKKEDKDAAKVSESDYNPAKPKYDPIKDACWERSKPVPYLALAKTLEAIEATSARLKMVEILSNYLRSVIALTPEDLLPSIYMCLNQLAPAYHSLELGVAETYLMKAVGQCTGRSLAQVRAAARAAGDLGAAAHSARATQRTMFAPPPLLARGVFRALKEIAAMTGQASVNKKIGKIQSLYVACRESEARYLIRSLEGKLRVGLAEQSLLQALALACAHTPPAGERAGEMHVAGTMNADKFKALVDEYALIIKTTYCECPNYELLVPVLLARGVRALAAHCRLTPGIPLKPMLAHPTRGVHEIFNRFEGSRFTCEWKYDGERAQIHVPPTGDGRAPDLAQASIFSRNQENNTSKYPDVLARLPALLKPSVHSCVLDCEAVAYDTQNKQILPFQVLSTRKRKDAAAAAIAVQVCVFVFDLLLLNGRALVREPLARRRDLLREHFTEVAGEWQMACSRDCSSMEEVQQFLEEAVRGSCEGLMVKTLEGEHAKYDIARRSHNWLKLKKDYLEGVGDTLDVVVIGAYRGRGRRAGHYGGFLLACYEPGAEEFQSLCKIGTGFSDEDLKTLSETLQQHVIEAPRSYYRYDSSHTPDVWFDAACVWEVRCADLSLSPVHRAALSLVDPARGISLRFPRFIRVRDDKTPEQATSARQIADLYLAQDQVKNNSAAKHVASDDFY